MKVSITKKTLMSLLIAGGLTVSFQATAEVHPGQVLHNDADCMKCHASKPYNPEKTTSWPKLVKTVQFCNDNLNAGMFEDEVEQLADYLNNTYYKFEK